MKIKLPEKGGSFKTTIHYKKLNMKKENYEWAANNSF